MAQEVDRPPDDGRVRLPTVDSAMVKIAPTAPAGDKGENKRPLRTGKPDKQKEDDEEILARARKRLQRAIEAESENRKGALDDLKFKSGEGQWPADVLAQRNFDNRPCVTVNKLLTFINQITNDQRQNRPGININPVGDRGDPEVAKMLSGLIRYFDRDSEADIAYDTAFDSAVSMGWGVWRTVTEYVAPNTFDQTVRVKRVRNPFTVYFDPHHQEPDAADAGWAFVTELITRDEFKDKYPDANPCSYTAGGIGDQFKHWIAKDDVRIAEYFEIDIERKKLVELSNGWVGWKDDASPEALAMFEIVQERESDFAKTMWYKMTAMEILSRQEFPCKWIPLVKVVGNEIDIEGKVKLSGIVRHAKGAQLMYNYFRTMAIELAALQPKAPYLMAEGQDEGYETEWKQANIKNFPVLHYRPVDIEGKPAPPPMRVAQVPATTGADQQAMIAAQDMMATTGIRFDATLNERMYDESGRALRELRRSGDLGSFHYIDNLARSLRQQGEIYLDLIPKILDTKRVMMILREDGSEEQIGIDPFGQKPMREEINPRTGKVMRIFNPTIGQYGVTVSIGPSYATKRVEAAESMMDFARALPNAAALIMDLIAKNQDWPGAEEMATRLAKAVPPQLLSPDNKDVPPQVQAMLSALDGQVKQLSAERQQLVAALTEQQSDRAQRQDKIEKDFEAKLMTMIANFETKMAQVQQKSEDSANRHIGSKIEDLANEMVELRRTLGEPQQTVIRRDGA